jgi:hypothetical protein
MSEWLTNIGSGPLNGLVVLIALAGTVFFVLKSTLKVVQWKPRGVLIGCSAAVVLLLLTILIMYLKNYHGFTEEVFRFSISAIALLLVITAMIIDAFWKSSRKLWAIIPLLVCSLGLVVTFLVTVDWDLRNKVVYPLLCGAAAVGFYFLARYLLLRNRHM